MDFVERWFGISPDGGDGTFEVLIVAAVIIIAGVFIFRRRLRRFFSSASKSHERTS